MTAHTINDVKIECIKGNIADQPDMDAVVNAANAELRIGGGVAGALHRAAGQGLEEECRPLAPIKPGMAVITGAHNLPNRHVIHCLGPIYGVDEPSDQLLADQKRIASLAFPALSTGAFGFPMEPAARIAFRTVLDEIPQLAIVNHIRFVLFSDADQKLHADILADIAG